jgi:hypothetical protein
MRKNNFFCRTEETIKDSTACPQWLEQFAEIQSIKQANVTINAVEVARQRNSQPSTSDIMRSLISGSKGQKFSSVDEVVADYQERTGLDKFINNQKSAQLKNAADQIISTASIKPIVVFAQDYNYADDSEDEMVDEAKEIEDINMSEFDRLLEKFNKAQEDYNKNMNAVEGFIEKHTPIFGKIQKQLDKLKGKDKETSKKRKKKASINDDLAKYEEAYVEVKNRLSDCDDENQCFKLKYALVVIEKKIRELKSEQFYQENQADEEPTVSLNDMFNCNDTEKKKY